MITNLKPKNHGFTLVELLVVIVIIASLAGLTAPMVIRQRKKGDQTTATNNARQIGLALIEFDNDYGSYPGASALAQLDTTASVTGEAGANSNGYFRMLFQASLTQSEDMFYAKAKSTIKPDGIITTNSEALKAGECGFGYLTTINEGLSSSGNPSRPLVITPLTPGATTLDPDPFDKSLVALRGDNSVVSLKMTVAAGATIGTVRQGTQDLFAAANPIWGGTAPTIKPPLRAGGS
jgi:prepilin-type N-terminal cleavage/methylation domain-containing protein